MREFANWTIGGRDEDFSFYNTAKRAHKTHLSAFSKFNGGNYFKTMTEHPTDRICNDTNEYRGVSTRTLI